jgi:hypothetical protein
MLGSHLGGLHHKDDDLKLPIVKQEQALGPNEGFNYFVSVGDPHAGPHQFNGH